MDTRTSRSHSIHQIQSSATSTGSGQPQQASDNTIAAAVSGSGSGNSNSGAGGVGEFVGYGAGQEGVVPVGVAGASLSLGQHHHLPHHHHHHHLHHHHSHQQERAAAAAAVGAAAAAAQAAATAFALHQQQTIHLSFQAEFQASLAAASRHPPVSHPHSPSCSSSSSSPSSATSQTCLCDYQTSSAALSQVASRLTCPPTPVISDPILSVPQHHPPTVVPAKRRLDPTITTTLPNTAFAHESSHSQYSLPLDRLQDCYNQEPVHVRKKARRGSRPPIPHISVVTMAIESSAEDLHASSRHDAPAHRLSSNLASASSGFDGVSVGMSTIVAAASPIPPSSSASPASQPSQVTSPSTPATTPSALGATFVQQCQTPLPFSKPSNILEFPLKVGERQRSKSLPNIPLHSISQPHRVHNYTSQNSKRSRPRRKASCAPSQSSNRNAPPVTLETLRELDLPEILRNTKLRHDVVFDAQLHFRPNLDGNRGHRKLAASEHYWSSVAREVESLLSIPPEARRSGHRASATKLPILLTTMRDILLSLVPYKDKQDVLAILDVPFLIDQIEHGAMDFVSLSRWLARVLKAHCAPMRDSWVDQMVERVEESMDPLRVDVLVSGLKMVFSILEAMKLDVANHQIRTLRPLLVSTAVDFEQLYFAERIQASKFDPRKSQAWFAKTLADYLHVRQKTDHLGAFCHGMLNIIHPTLAYASSSTSEANIRRSPDSFVFDQERLEALRHDVADCIALRLSVLLFRQLVSGSKREVDAETTLRIQHSVLAVLGEDPDQLPPVSSHASRFSKWLMHASDIGIQLALEAKRFCSPNSPAEVYPSPQQMALAQSWLEKHIDASRPSPVFKLVEREVLANLEAHMLSLLRSWESPMAVGASAAAAAAGASASGRDRAGAVDVRMIAERTAGLGFIHWRIWSGIYTQGLPAVR